jgi:hypothetical protein
MLVYYKLVSGGSYILLFDESAGDANEKFNPSFRDTIMKLAGYGAANMTKVPLANTDGQVSFRFSKNYATADAATTGIVTLRSTFKGISVHLKVVTGATTVYFPNAQLSGSSHDQSGREVLHEMSFDTDDITTTAP